MEDPNQIEVPPSFVALFTSPSGHRLTQPMTTVRTRYELCEDLAQALAEQAPVTLFKSGAGQADVLQQIGSALTTDGSALDAPEAAWVVRRLAELLGWEPGAGD